MSQAEQFLALDPAVQAILNICERTLQHRCRLLGFGDEPIRKVIEEGYIFIFANPVLYTHDYIDDDGAIWHHEQRNIEFVYGPADYAAEQADNSFIFKLKMSVRVVILNHALIMRLKADGTDLRDGANIKENHASL